MSVVRSSSKLYSSAGGRRMALAAPILVGVVVASPRAMHASAAERGLSRYVKEKKLQPLSVYLPSILRAEASMENIAQSLTEVDKTDTASISRARSSLRAGDMARIREGLRAIGEYNNDSSFSQRVLGDLEQFDIALLRWGRGEQIDIQPNDLRKVITAIDGAVMKLPPEEVRNARAQS